MNCTCHLLDLHYIFTLSELSKLRAEMKKKVQRSDGPFFSILEKSLNELNVERQAYQGGTFVGNHVHKLLKVSCNSSIACSSLLCLSDSPVVLMFSQGTLASCTEAPLPSESGKVGPGAICSPSTTVF